MFSITTFKLASSLLKREGQSLVEYEAALTDAVVGGIERLRDPEVEFKVHLLFKASFPNSIIVGFEKIQSRKKSFESMVGWIGSYMNGLVKGLTEELRLTTDVDDIPKEN